MKKLISFLFGVLAYIPSGFVFSQTNLNSLPGSAYVLYLDFDGHSDNSGWWSSGTFPNPIVTGASSLSSSQITEVFNRVSEDFRPFNINVTTQASVYNAAPTANRQRVVFTDDSEFYTDEKGPAGGVAYLNTFGGGEIACYVFTNFLGSSAKNAAEAGSHEAGHTLGLRHHSKYNSDCTKDTEYNPGLGDGQTDWAPIMGVSYNSNISQWYTGAANGSTCTSILQDDLAVITTNNGFGYRTDDFGNTIATSAGFPISGTTASTKGVISTTSDVDVFKITVSTVGTYSFFSFPTATSSTSYDGANLDVKMWITNSTGATIQTADNIGRLDASLPAVVLNPGIYYVFIDGTGIPGYKDIGGTGTVDYGSIGEYTLTITRLCTPVITSTTTANRCGAGSLTLRATNSAGTLRWFATNTSSTVLGTGTSFTTPTLSATTTYFVDALATGCATASARVPVTATINAAPVANAGANRTFAQDAGNQLLTATPTGGIWSGTGVSTAGIFSPGRPPGTYPLVYCASIGSCSSCDTVLVTVTAPATQVANPVITPATGTYTSAQTITITCPTPNVTLYYTLTGNTPVIGTGFTKVYTGPFTVSQTCAVKAMGVRAGLTNSSVTTNTITINLSNVVATPVIVPGTGTYSGQQTVTISSATPGTTIYYTTNGVVPGTVVNSITRLYTGPFTMNASATIRALAVKAGMTNSAIGVAFLTITNATPTVATPVISPGTGTYSGPQTMTITCSTPGATIYYTTSGNLPTVGTSFTRVYTGPFVANVPSTVWAMATAPGSNNSGFRAAYLSLAAVRSMVSSYSEEDDILPGTEQSPSSSLKVFPNPSNGLVSLEGFDKNARLVEVVNVRGQVVRSVPLPDAPEKLTIDLQKEVPGLYLVRVISDAGIQNLNLVIR